MDQEPRNFRGFQEEIENLTAENKSSFTALLGLPANQAMLLLHDPGVVSDSNADSSPQRITKRKENEKSRVIP